MDVDNDDPPHRGEREKIGYGRPPVHSRFKPLQSGNPRGRPKKCTAAPEIGTLIADALNTVVPLGEGRRRRRTMTLGKLLVRNLVTGAAKGDAKALRQLLAYLKVYPPPAQDKDRYGSRIDYGAQVRAKIEEMARRLEPKQDDGTAGHPPKPGKPEEA